MRRVMDPKRGTEYLFKEFLFPRVRESYEDLSEVVRGAGLLLTHPVTFAGPLVAEKEKVPWASTVLAPISFFSAHDLPVFPPFPWLAALRRFRARRRSSAGGAGQAKHEAVDGARSDGCVPDLRSATGPGPRLRRAVLAAAGFGHVLARPGAAQAWIGRRTFA
jgi:hypothetical protein